MRGRDAVALILAVCAGLSILALTLAALFDALSDPEQAGLSQEYMSLLTGTLGVLVGALAGYVGGSRHVSDSVGSDMPAEVAGIERPGQTPTPADSHLWEPNKHARTDTEGTDNG